MLYTLFGVPSIVVLCNAGGLRQDYWQLPSVYCQWTGELMARSVSFYCSSSYQRRLRGMIFDTLLGREKARSYTRLAGVVLAIPPGVDQLGRVNQT